MTPESTPQSGPDAGDVDDEIACRHLENGFLNATTAKRMQRRIALRHFQVSHHMSFGRLHEIWRAGDMYVISYVQYVLELAVRARQGE